MNFETTILRHEISLQLCTQIREFGICKLAEERLTLDFGFCTLCVPMKLLGDSLLQNRSVEIYESCH